MTAAGLLFAAVLLLAAALAVLIARRATSAAVSHIMLASGIASAWAITSLLAPHIVVPVIALATWSTALALAAFRNTAEPNLLMSAGALLAAVAASMLAWRYGWPVVGALPVLASVVALFVLGVLALRTQPRDALMLLASAGAVVASAAANIGAGNASAMPFAAVATLGVALAVSPASRLAIEDKRGWQSRRLAVRRKR
jgi:hypothetical protein